MIPAILRELGARFFSCGSGSDGADASNMIHQLRASEACVSLGSSPHGLSAEEARRRLSIYGPNSVEIVRSESVLLRLLKQFAHLFALILWVAAGFAFIAEWSDPGHGMARVGIAVVAVIVVSGVFSFWQERRVEKTLAALRQLLPSEVDALRDGTVARIAAEQIVPGDLILLEPGANVPADCRLIEAFSVRVNNSTITGESLPKTRHAEPCDQRDILHAENVLLAGTSLVSGRATAVVFATGMHTEFGKIARLSQTGHEPVSPLRMQVAHLTQFIAVLSITIGFSFFLISRAIGVPFWEGFIFAIGIIVAMVPEGLLPTLTLALVLATQRLAKRNVLIRYLPSVETLGSTTVICTDKTGTLTRNEMTVKEVALGAERPRGLPLENHLAERYRPFFLVAAHCHDLREGEHDGKKISIGDPMEVALAELAHRALGDIDAVQKIGELPFDTDRMRLSTVHAMAEGQMHFCKGAPEAVIQVCDRIWTGEEIRPFDQTLCAKVRDSHEEMASRGLRVIAMCYQPLDSRHTRPVAEEGLIFVGTAGLEDPPREEVPDAILKCRRAGIRVIMVTGDHPHTAHAIAREIGLVREGHPIVITGEQIRALSESQLRQALNAPDIIFARTVPDQKMRIVEALKSNGHVVAVTGDGVNDAPALKSAHIGVAMGIAGSDVAKEASDMVLLDDNFASIVNAIEEGRAIFINIRKFLTYILAHNVPELVPYLAFSLFKIPLAITPIQILSIDMGTDSLTALGLGTEAANPRIMSHPPRSPRERLFNWPLAVRAYLFLGLIEAAIAMAAFFSVLHAGGWMYAHPLSSDDPLYQQATTACLSAVVTLQIVNVFLCRSATRSIFSTGLSGNPLILWGVVLEIVLLGAIAYTPWGNFIFETKPLHSGLWLCLLPFAIVMAILEELRKWYVRSKTLPIPAGTFPGSDSSPVSHGESGKMAANRDQPSDAPR
jgi:sodium/potassium-transporting ATPase subunit alpha